jgi:hypothetical protein
MFRKGRLSRLAYHYGLGDCVLLFNQHWTMHHTVDSVTYMNHAAYRIMNAVFCITVHLLPYNLHMLFSSIL